MLSRMTNVDAMSRYRMSTVLIWLGVLVWVPFIVLMVMGQKPSVFGYLPFHLIGVVGGSSMRKAARAELGLPRPARNWLRVAGHVAIFLGISVWGPYFYAKLVLQTPVEASQYVPFHLAGVLIGVVLLVLAARKNRGE